MRRGLFAVGLCCHGVRAALPDLGDSVTLLQLGGAATSGDNPGIPPEVFKAIDIYDKKTRQDAMVFLNITKEVEKAWGREVGKFLDKSVKRQFKLLGTAGKVLGENAKAVNARVDKWMDENVKNGKIISDAVDTAKANQNKGSALLRKWWEKNKNWNQLGAGSLIAEGSKKDVVSPDALREQEIDDQWKQDVAQLLPDLPLSVLEEPQTLDFLKWLGRAAVGHGSPEEAREAPAPASGDVKRWLHEALGPATAGEASLSEVPAEPAEPEETAQLPSWVEDLGNEVAQTLKQNLEG